MGTRSRQGNTPLTPIELWDAARRFGMELDREWTFALHLCRVLALSTENTADFPTGIDLHYERVSSWPDVVRALQSNELLDHYGVPARSWTNVTVEMEVFDSIYRTRTGRLESRPSDVFRGRHSSSLVGITADNDLIFQNSWGPRWGDDGIGYIPRLYFEQHVRGVWLKRPAYLGWSPRMDAILARQSPQPGRNRSRGDVGAVFGLPNRPSEREVRVNGVRSRVRLRQVVGSTARAPLFELIDISAHGRLLGRANIELAPDVDDAVIHDLFVRPDDRRGGVGAALLGLAEERGRAAGRRSISVMLHEADNSEEATENARQFLASSEYHITTSESIAPYILGTRKLEL